MTDPKRLPELLRQILGHPLPGPDAQLEMAPTGRGLPDDPHDHLAAVLIALIWKENRWQFPLIHRVEDGYAHGGQIGLPGGRKEADETPEETALREAHEEVGLDPERVTLLGRLSPLPVPVSKTQVMPIVGLVDGVPDLAPDPKEVQSIFLVGIDDLLGEEKVRQETRTLRLGEFHIPYYFFQGHKVWGATAMMLSELRTLLKQVM